MCEAKSERECNILYDQPAPGRATEECDPERRRKRRRELRDLNEATNAQYTRATVKVDQHCPASPTIHKVFSEYHNIYDDHGATKDFENNEDRYYTPFPERRCYKVVKRDMNGEIVQIMATI